MSLKEQDIEIFEAIRKEKHRQQDHLELIASENYVSNEVLEAQGSILTNKYAEGYIGKRYYGGCEYVDEVETSAKERLKALFDAKFVNVQPHSGSQANMAAIRSLVNYGDKIMGMALDSGGHLTHGHKLSFSGMDYEIIPYCVDKNGYLDYEEIRRIALENKPKLIIAGASAYSRKIDFAKFREIADEVSAFLMVDMAHIAGLVAANCHMNPIYYADVVTSTTHKTLRGPRGGIILTNNEDLAKKIDKMIFPGTQGGPLMHIIAAKAVCFKEALSDSYKEYIEQVVKNAHVLAETLLSLGYEVVSGGTDNHLLTINIKKKTGLTGKQGEALLEKVNITVNKNTVPFDPEKPFITSGLRLGSPALTSRGFKESEMIIVAKLIDRALMNSKNEVILEEVKQSVIELLMHFPLWYKED